MSYNIEEIPDWCEEDYTTYLKEQELESISVDKMTLNDRVQWTQENMDEILYAGKNLEFSKMQRNLSPSLLHALNGMITFKLKTRTVCT